jgi:hypothetical protein
MLCQCVRKAGAIRNINNHRPAAAVEVSGGKTIGRHSTVLQTWCLQLSRRQG